MSSVCLPVPLVALIKRIFNAFSALSITQSALVSNWTASSEAAETQSSEADPSQAQKKREKKEESESTWDFLERLKKSLPSQGESSLKPPEPEKDSLEESRQRHAEALAQQRHLAHPHSPINRIVSNPQLFDPVRAPRNPIVLCHGLYGFDVRGFETFPKLRMHYWANVLHILKKKVGAEVVVTGVPGTGSIASRAERMDRFLREKVKGREINFVAHSMGGLDCRHLITHIRPQEYHPLSLTSLSVPHRGSPFMDWCLVNIGIGSPRPFPFPCDPQRSRSSSHQSTTTTFSHSEHSRQHSTHKVPYSLSSPLLSRPTTSAKEKASFTLSMLPSGFTSLLLSLIDSPAYANLTTTFLRDVFNPSTPDKLNVKYFSLAARTTKMSIWHPLWLPKLIIDAAEEQEALMMAQGNSSSSSSHSHTGSSDLTVSYPDLNFEREEYDPERGNDGLVTVSSAKWGKFLGVIEGCDHWEVRGARGLGADWDEGWGKMWKEWIGKLSSGSSNGPDKGENVWSVVGQAKEAVEKREALKRDNVHPKAEKMDWATQNGLTTKFDLERFYVAISRKLYDEGL